MQLPTPDMPNKRMAAILALTMIALPVCRMAADPVATDFSAKNSGYEAGPLGGQNGWIVRVQAPANSDFSFVPGSGLQLVPNTGGSHAVAYAFINDKETTSGRDSFPAGLPISFSVNFVMKKAAPSNKAPVLAIGWGLFVPVGMNNLPFSAGFVREAGDAGFRLTLFRQSDKTQVTGDTSVAIPAEDLGFKAGGESDPLQLSFTLTNQGDPKEWSAVSMLTNLATKKAFVLKNTMTAPEVYKTDDLLRAIVNLRRFSEDGLESVTITKVDDEVVPDPGAQ